MTATILTVLTPPGRGAIATLAVRGPHAANAVQNFFAALSGAPIGDLPVGRVAVGHWRSGSTAEELVIGRVGSEQFEVNCHGGDLAVQRIVADLESLGVSTTATVAEQRLDPVQQAAAEQLQRARTTRCAAVLLDQYRGAMSRELQAIRRLPSLETRQSRVAQVLQFRNLGEHLVDPWRVAVVGPPNVGKSSLLNAMLGYQRAIVFDEPGTTRDAVTAITVWNGWPIELIDTAGIREADSEVEQLGIGISQQQMATADLVLQVFDVRERAPEMADHHLPVANKCDLGGHGDGIVVSAKTGQGISTLCEAIVNRLIPIVPPPGAAVPITQDVVDDLHRLIS